jgi:hypothetical protein
VSAALGLEYPKMLYGPNGMTSVVMSAMEMEALGSEWSSVPGDAHRAPLATNSVVMDGVAPRAVPPVAPPVPAAPQPQAPAFDEAAFAEHVALRVDEMLAPLLPKRTGRPPNPEKESQDG